MTKDTKIGGDRERFPATRWSAIAAAGSKDAFERNRAFDTLVRAYWKPVYKTIRMQWHKSNEDAKDLTQSFFCKIIEKDFLKNFDPTKARFRIFLRTCLNGFLANEEKAARRIKRGGNRHIVSLDFASAEQEISKMASQPSTADEYFDREWVRSVLSLTVEALQEQCQHTHKSLHFNIFERYDLNDEARPTYEDLAQEFDLTTTQVTNYLAFVRREFRRILLQKLRELTLTEEEFRHEARTLLGIDFKEKPG